MNLEISIKHISTERRGPGGGRRLRTPCGGGRAGLSPRRPRAAACSRGSGAALGPRPLPGEPRGTRVAVLTGCHPGQHAAPPTPSSRAHEGRQASPRGAVCHPRKAASRASRGGCESPGRPPEMQLRGVSGQICILGPPTPRAPMDRDGGFGGRAGHTSGGHGVVGTVTRQRVRLLPGTPPST